VTGPELEKHGAHRKKSSTRLARKRFLEYLHVNPVREVKKGIGETVGHVGQKTDESNGEKERVT